MANPKLLLLIPNLLFAVLLVVSSIPLIRGRVAPNWWYGFRVRPTLENPRLWYPVNRFAAFHFLGLGIVLLVVVPTMYFLPQIDFIPYSLICLATVLFGISVGLVRSFRYLRRLQQSEASR